MLNIPEETIATIVWFMPFISLAINISLALSVAYLLRKNAKIGEFKSTDQKIAGVYKLAEFKSAELMKDATEKAKRIVSEAGITKDTLESRLEDSLNKMTESLDLKLNKNQEDIYLQFKKVFESISQSYQSEGAHIVTNFKEEGDTVVKTFIQTVHAEINSVREQIFGKIDAKMTMIDEDLEKYRVTQYQKLDQNLKKIAKGTLETYLKDTLTADNHEQILFKALDKFKKEDAINSANVK